MTQSPLALVVQDEKVHLILNDIRDSVKGNRPFHIDTEDMNYMKKKFQEGIQTGEAKLHELCFQIIRDLAELQEAKVTLVVWGRCINKEHRDIVKSFTNVELGDVISAAYMDSIIAWSHSPLCKVCGQKTTTIASFNQYRFDKNYPSGLKIILSRIKSTSNICYKIADMVFDIDRMFQRDKIINQYTQTLTDMYGLKIVFVKKEDIFRTLEYLKSLPGTELLSEKNYLDDRKKKSGYEAYKTILKKDDQLCEIQLQTVAMLDVEKSSLNASHQTYKERQMEERKKLGDVYQNLYDVLIQIFSTTDELKIQS